MGEDLRPMREQDPTLEERAYDEGRGVATLEYRERISQLERQNAELEKENSMLLSGSAEAAVTRQSHITRLEIERDVAIAHGNFQTKLGLEWKKEAEKLERQNVGLQQKVSDAEALWMDGDAMLWRVMRQDGSYEWRCGHTSSFVPAPEVFDTPWEAIHWMLARLRESADG